MPYKVEAVAREWIESQNLQLGLGGREFSRDYRVGKAGSLMRAVAEGLVRGVAAAAQRHDRAPGQLERCSLRVHDFEIAFDSDGAVVLYGDFGRHL